MNLTWTAFAVRERSFVELPTHLDVPPWLITYVRHISEAGFLLFPEPHQAVDRCQWVYRSVCEGFDQSERPMPGWANTDLKNVILSVMVQSFEART